MKSDITKCSRLLLLVGACVVATNSHAADKPNILVIVSDDHGYADVGFQGCKDIPTPHLDRLAREGLRCTNGYVIASVLQPDAGWLDDRPLPAAVRS